MSQTSKAAGHGLPDEAISSAHDMIHHAEQEEHEHEAAARRGLTDDVIEAEHEFEEGVEEQYGHPEEYNKPSSEPVIKVAPKIKETMEKLMSGNNNRK